MGQELIMCNLSVARCYRINEPSLKKIVLLAVMGLYTLEQQRFEVEKGSFDFSGTLNSRSWK